MRVSRKNIKLEINGEDRSSGLQSFEENERRDSSSRCERKGNTAFKTRKRNVPFKNQNLEFSFKIESLLLYRCSRWFLREQAVTNFG